MSLPEDDPGESVTISSADFAMLTDELESLRQQLSQVTEQRDRLLPLLKAANCPECVDKSGVYHGNDGEPCQCRWCFETNALIAEIEGNKS